MNTLKFVVEYDCPSCSQTLAFDSFGDFECPHCGSDVQFGYDEYKKGGPLWKDLSPSNKIVASFISKLAVLFGGILVLLTAIAPGPLKLVGVVIIILYCVIAPRVLEINELIGSDWRNSSDHGGDGGGGGG